MRRAVRTAAVLTGILFTGCVGSPTPPTGAACQSVAPGGHIVDAAWIKNDTVLVVTTQTGPFASTDPGREAFWDILWPRLDLTLNLEADAHGSIVGRDGSIYLLRQDGIWAQSPGSTEPVLTVPISNAEQDVVDWAWSTRGFAVMLRSTGNAVDLFEAGGHLAERLVPSDAAAYAIWLSSDGQSSVVTRLDGPDHVQFVVRRGDTTGTFDSGESFPRFEWLTTDGRLVFESRGNGLMVASLGGSAIPVADGLPHDYNAVSEPGPGGVLAYSGRDRPADQICFSPALSGIGSH